MRKTNLVIVAHPDDEILGFGATGSALISKGEIVQPLIICGEVAHRKYRPNLSNLKTDIINANKFLGFSAPIILNYPNLELNTIPTVNLVKDIEKVILNFKPNRIFTHHHNDLNEDHFFVFKATMAAVKYFQRNKIIESFDSIFLMEILSSSEWGLINNNLFSPNTFIDIEGHISKKISSLKLYKRILRKPPHPRSIRSIKALVTYRGSQSGFKFAEAFERIYSNLI